jgi:hypothetical protein
MAGKKEWAVPKADYRGAATTSWPAGSTPGGAGARLRTMFAPTSCRARDIPIPIILSHQVLDEVLQNHRIKSNDLAGIDKLFGGADGYYWYHTLRHMCPKGEVIVWSDEESMRAAVQNHENESAAEDEVKPQVLRDAHVAAIARLLAVRG